MAVQAPEMRSVFFEPGRRVRIQPLASERTYYCFIEDVPNGTLHLTMPMAGREYAPIATGERVRLAVERRGNLYLFESIVTGRCLGDHPMLIIKRPPDHAATQRRAHVRVPVLLEATFWLADEHRPGHERPVKVVLVNLSAGGLGFRSKEHLTPGTPVTVEFAIPPETKRRDALRRSHAAALAARRWSRRTPSYAAYIRMRNEDSASAGAPISVAAAIVHCAATTDEPEVDWRGQRVPRVYFGGAHFVALSDVLRERIIRYVVRREVELRFRGLL